MDWNCQRSAQILYPAGGLALELKRLTKDFAFDTILEMIQLLQKEKI